MAYGLKYFSEFADDQEIGYRVEIHQRDYSGDSIEVKSSGNPFVIEVTELDNIYSPIRTKKATIEWVAEEGNDFEIKDLFIDDDQKYKVYLYEIKEGDVLVNYFTGYLVTVDCKEPFQSKPYHVQMSAGCGLFFLHDYTFTSDNGEFVLGKASIKDAIGQCLQFAGLELDFHTYVDLYDIQMASGDPLALAEVDPDGLRGVTCYDALSGILNAFNAFVVQEGDIWVVKGIPELNALSTNRRIYDFQGVFKSADVVNQAVSIGRTPFDNDIPNLIPTENVTSSIADTSSVVKSQISPGIAVNRLLNGQFAYPILGGNLRGWDINLDTLQQISDDPLEPAGWQRTGTGRVDDPYKFEIRGAVTSNGKQIDSGNSEQNHIDISDPIIIDAGLFNKGQKVKIVISGAYRVRGVNGLYMECYTNDNEKDTISWLDETGKWNPEKKLKNRHGIIIKGNVNVEPNLLTPANELPIQTFEINSDTITDYLKRDVDGIPHAICKIYFRIFPATVYDQSTLLGDELERAPLLVLEDISIAVTTETAYEGEHSYIVDADIPIRNANEVDYTSIVSDKLNIFTPEQVRLTNRVMTGYMTLTFTDNLTYAWKRKIGGNDDPIDGIAYPIQYKTLKERLRQLCGKRIIIEGDFLGYDLKASNSIFLQYDDAYNSDKFYTVTGWKWDIINRRYTVKINELSLEKLTSEQEYVELDKSGSGSRGNRLYGNASGGSTSGGGGNTISIDPIELDIIDPIYFTVNKQSVQIFDLGSYIISGHLPEELTTKIVYYPTWMNPIYEDRGVDGDILIYSANGTPRFKGHDQIVIELTGLEEETYLAVIPIVIQDPVTNVSQIIDGTTLDILGTVPGFFPVPALLNFRTKINGTHDKVVVSISGGGASGDSRTQTKTFGPFESTVDIGNYLFFELDDGEYFEVGVYDYTVEVYRGTFQTSLEKGKFTLYDEEYLTKASNELYDTSKDELLGVIDIEGDNTFKSVPSFDIKTIIADLEHDKISFVLNKDGVEVFSVEYESDPAITDKEYNLFDSVVASYGAGKYDLTYTISLLGADVYQRNASFEFTEADVLPEAGVDLITFKANTINYSVVDSLPLFNYQADLPDNWGLKIPVPSVDYDFVEWKLYDSTTGGLAEVDVETYTNLPQFISYEDGSTKKDILVFELKNSTDIDSIHRAPSSFRLKALFKLGGISGKVVAIKQADFAFRVPLEPDDYSGTRFLNVDGSTITVIDSNMPKTGTKYILPTNGLYSVSAREYNGELFDSVKVKYSKFVDDAYVVLHYFGADYVVQWNSPSGTDVVETPSDDTAYLIGIAGGDGLRYLNSSGGNVIIDEVGQYKASFEFSKDGVLIGTKTTEFELIDGSEPPVIPVKDCCGGEGTTLPVYPDVVGTWGTKSKTVRETLTENGTISAIEEIDIEPLNMELLGDTWYFDDAPKVYLEGTDLNNLATYGQVLNALASGRGDKQPVKTVATSSVSLSGLQTINGYTLLSGDRVLVTAQSPATENGCYVASSGSWIRASDSDTGTELLGATYLVTEGSLTTNQTKWKVTNSPPITVGTTAITIIQVQGAEIDPTVPTWVKAITSTQISNWDLAYTGYTNFNSMFDTRFGTKTTTNLVEGTNKYFTEQRVRDTPLTGLVTTSSVALSATDTIIVSLGKLQAQIVSNNTRWNGLPSEDTDINLIREGGVKTWSGSAINSPYGPGGTSLTFVGNTANGNGNSNSSWINQILAGTDAELSWRQSVNDWNTWTATYKIWTTKHFSATNVSNWNTAYGWGNHALAGYMLSSDFNGLFDTRLSSKTTNNLTEGTTNKYFTEARVLATVLTGFTVGANSSILATDTVLSAFGKTQGQINGLTASIATKENAFSKGNLVAGSNITLSGTLTNRLVGGGDITITGLANSLTGTGTVGRLSKFGTSSTLVDSILEETSGRVNALGIISGQTVESNAAPSNGNVNGLTLSNAGSVRWVVGKFGLESGTNSGSDLYFSRLSDSGGFLGNTIVVVRATGAATFESTVSVGTPTSNSHATTKIYVDNLVNGYVLSSNFNSLFDARLATKSTTNLTEGSNLYFTVARVLATALTGFSVGANSTISVTDTILGAFGKTQGQINALVTSVATKENSFSKGNIIAGTGISITGTLTSRLVGTGDITISSTTTGIGGSGTVNTIPLFATSSSIADSILSQSGGYVNSSGGLSAQVLQSNASPSSSGVVGFIFSSSGSQRWNFGKNGLETGSNVGSDLYMSRFNDAGAYVGNSFMISRATGETTFYLPLTIQTPTSSAHATTKAYVDGLIGGKESAFSKGNLIAGSKITFSGSGSNRLVNSGDLTISLTTLTIYDITDLPGILNAKAETSVTNDLQSQINGKANVSHTHSLSQITNADDVNAIENLTGTGVLKRLGTNSWSVGAISISDVDSLTGTLNSKADVSVTNSLQSQINGKMPIDRTITINGNTQSINNNPSFTISSSGGTITGSGTTNVLAKWTGSGSIGDSRIYDAGSGTISMTADFSAYNISASGNLSASSALKVGSGSLNPAAILHLDANNRGFLLPRMSETQMQNISSPPVGLVVFVDSGSGLGLWCYYGSSYGWRIMATRLWVGASSGGSAP